MLNEEEKKTALKVVRYVLESWVRDRKKPTDLETRFPITDKLKEKRGVFVTLEVGRQRKKKDLRGCIGYITGVKPVYKTIADNAVNASTEDDRFPPVTPKELGNICIEVSVMTPLEVCRPEDIVVGRDGLIIEKGFYSGLLLPQVATEYGWNRTEFLEQTCWKAGLYENAWKEPDTVIKRFSAQVFNEDEYPELYKEKY